MHNRSRIRLAKSSLWKKGFFPEGVVYYVGMPVFQNGEGWDDVVAVVRYGMRTDDSIKKLLRTISGHFAFIVCVDNVLLAVVDKIRSYPIFMCNAEERIFSDNARDFVEVGVDFNSHVAEEFLLAGYVTGAKTLVPSIRQLQAGEFLLEDSGESVCDRYYMYGDVGVKCASCSSDDFCESIDSILTDVFKELVAHAGSKTICIPLSGGCDSRLIAAKIKEVGCDTVVCYAYGTPQSADVKMSEQVAAALGFKWIHIPYSRDMWHAVAATDNFYSYCKKQHNFSVLPPIVEWPAIQAMHEMCDGELLFVPGHTGDFISGGHLSYIPENVTTDLHTLALAIVEKHFSLWKRNPANIEKQVTRIERVLTELSHFVGNDARTCYEAWEWQERQAKYIVNTVRQYEWFGSEWSLPLWDSRVMDFFARVPLEEKQGKKLYYDYLEKKNPAGVFSKERFRVNGSAKKGGYMLAQNMRLLKKAYLDYWCEPTQRYSLFPAFSFLLNRHKIRNVNALWGRYVLEEMLLCYTSPQKGFRKQKGKKLRGWHV